MMRSNGITICVLVGFTLLMACGPDTIWVRPGLDTPSQHVINGRQFIDRGKLEDAFREFNRAIELDPQYTSAYIELGLALGYQGDVVKAMETMDQAKAVADSPDERDAVQQGYDKLSEIIQKK